MACEPAKKAVEEDFFSPSIFYIIFNTSRVHVNKITTHSYTLFLLPFAVFFML